MCFYLDEKWFFISIYINCVLLDRKFVFILVDSYNLYIIILVLFGIVIFEKFSSIWVLFVIYDFYSKVFFGQLLLFWDLQNIIFFDNLCDVVFKFLIGKAVEDNVFQLVIIFNIKFLRLYIQVDNVI